MSYFGIYGSGYGDGPSTARVNVTNGSADITFTDVSMLVWQDGLEMWIDGANDGHYSSGPYVINVSDDRFDDVNGLLHRPFDGTTGSYKFIIKLRGDNSEAYPLVGEVLRRVRTLLPVSSDDFVMTLAKGADTDNAGVVLTTGGVNTWRAGAFGADDYTVDRYVSGAWKAMMTIAAATGIMSYGANGAANPAFRVDASVASVATGVGVTGAAAGSRATVAALSSAPDEGLTFNAKGAGTIRLGVASTGPIEFSRAAVPTASDGAALGSTSLMWSDLFLASGAVINFNAGNVTITHSAGQLAISGIAAFTNTTAATAYNLAGATFAGGIGVAGAVIGNSTANFSGTVFSGGDIQLSRTSFAYGYLTRPNTAGAKSLGFVVSGGGALDDFLVNSVQLTFQLGANTNVLVKKWAVDESYNALSLNSDVTSAMMGIVGGNSTDPYLYYMAKTAGGHVFRIANSDVVRVTTTGLDIGAAAGATAYFKVDAALANQAGYAWRSAGVNKWLLYRVDTTEDLAIYNATVGQVVLFTQTTGRTTFSLTTAASSSSNAPVLFLGGIGVAKSSYFGSASVSGVTVGITSQDTAWLVMTPAAGNQAILHIPVAATLNITTSGTSRMLIDPNGVISLSNTTASTGIGIGALNLSGGLSAAAQSYFGDNVFVAKTYAGVLGLFISNVSTGAGAAAAFGLTGATVSGGNSINFYLYYSSGSPYGLLQTGPDVTAFYVDCNTQVWRSQVGTEAMRLNSGRLTLSNPTGGLGYGTGAGGTVTQATNKSTGVTLNKVCGQITMNNAALAAGASVSFTVTNSAAAATDLVAVAIASGATANSYTVTVSAVAAGSFNIMVHNVSGGSLSEAIVISFAIVKAVNA